MFLPFKTNKILLQERKEPWKYCIAFFYSSIETLGTLALVVPAKNWKEICPFLIPIENKIMSFTPSIGKV